MLRINWNKFKVINEDYRKEFEELSYFLFCRKFSIAEGIRADYNQIGLETYPIFDPVKKEWVGFQAKFFDNKLSDSSSVEQIKKSIRNAKKSYKKLDRIIIYTHQKFGNENPKYKVEIEKEAEKIKIDWVLDDNLKILLSSNLDLAQLYFGVSDELSFIESCSYPKILTFLQSSEYIKLPFINSKTEKIEDITKKILKTKQKDFLLSGHPGSGKSISIHKLFQVFSGLDKNSLDDVKKVLQKNKAVPMLINLKNCTFETIENIVRNRQNDYKVRNGNLGFIYLLDGLDELSVEKADHVLSYLYELEKDDNTKKIILS